MRGAHDAKGIVSKGPGMEATSRVEPDEGGEGRASPGISYFLRPGTQGSTDSVGQAIPVGGFFAETLAASGGEFVELRAAIIFGCAPIRLEQALTHDAKETGIEGALFDQQGITGDLSDAEKNAVSVERAEGNRTEDQQVESAGKQLRLVRQEILLR